MLWQPCHRSPTALTAPRVLTLPAFYVAMAQGGDAWAKLLDVLSSNHTDTFAMDFCVTSTAAGGGAKLVAVPGFSSARLGDFLIAMPNVLRELIIRIPHDLPPLINPGHHGKLQHLQTLDLRESLITRLPDWLQQLSRLSRLILADCSGLIKLPECLAWMSAPWVELDLTGCYSIRPSVIEGSNDVVQTLVERNKDRVKSNLFKVSVTNPKTGKLFAYRGLALV
jgi:hypothetical protein